MFIRFLGGTTIPTVGIVVPNTDWGNSNHTIDESTKIRGNIRRERGSY